MRGEGEQLSTERSPDRGGLRERESPVPVLLADGVSAARRRLRAAVEAGGRATVVAEASSGAQAVTRARELKPRVVALCLEITGPGAVTTLRRLNECSPTSAVLIVCGTRDRASVWQTLSGGAAGYLPKGAPRGLVGSAVVALSHGATVVGGTLLQRALNGAALTTSEGAVRRAGGPNAAERPLTDREYRILLLLAEGHTNKQIGHALALAEVTVKKHLRSMMEKLSAVNRTQVAVTAVHLGLLPLPAVHGNSG